MATQSALYVDPPVVPRLPYGLFSVVQDRSGGNSHWLQGVETESDACVTPLPYGNGWCAISSLRGTPEAQRVTITGTPTGGSFTLSFRGETTAAIPYNATAAQVSTALEALPSIGANGVAVLNGPLPGTAVNITFIGPNVAGNIDQMTATGSFTGGTTPAVAVTTVTPGTLTAKTISDAVISSSGTTSAMPVTVYTLRECGTVGDDAQARAMSMFNAAEQTTVEAWFWAAFANSGTTGAYPSHLLTVQDLTGGTARTSVKAGLAELEGYMGHHYAGIPIVHVDREVGSMLGSSQSIERHPPRLESIQGAWVSAGGGYGTTGPANTNPTAGEVWMYATGQIAMYSGAANLYGPFLQQDATGLFYNKQVVMVERQYLFLIDCVVAAVRAQLQ